MYIAIRKEPNGSIYIDKEIYSKTQKIQDENGNIEVVPMFTDEELSQPPYNYTKVEIDDKYSDCQASDFEYISGQFKFNESKYNTRKEVPIKQQKLTELETWFNDYFEKQLIQSMWQTNFKISHDNYFDKDYISVEELKLQGEIVRSQIKDIRSVLNNGKY